MALTESPPFELTEEQVARFQADGFVVVDRIIDRSLAALALARYEELFAGNFETGLYPDEWNWRAGTRRPGPDPPDLQRVEVRPRHRPGRAPTRHRKGLCPPGRLARDPVEPGQRLVETARAESRWGSTRTRATNSGPIPPDWVSCWIALEDTTAQGGTVEYVRGSHRWQPWGMITEFHGPRDPHRDLREAAAAAGVQPELVPVEVPAGGGAFHAGWTWHGSGVNHAAVPRRSLVAHCMSSEARFHPDTVGYLYSRYKRFGDDTMDETFFPDHVAPRRVPLAVHRALLQPTDRMGCAPATLIRWIDQDRCVSWDSSVRRRWALRCLGPGSTSEARPRSGRTP